MITARRFPGSLAVSTLFLFGLCGCGTRAAPLADGAAPANRNGWTVHVDSAASAVRDATLAAAHDLSCFLGLLRPLPRRITLRLQPCGQASEAVWLPASAEILVCDEIVEWAAQFAETPRPAARYILAHELGHAVADLFSEPAFGGSEVDADEFAAVFLIATGTFQQDVVEAARLLDRMADIPDLLDPVHAERRARAEALRCLADGALGRKKHACTRVFETARSRWQRRVLERID